MIMTKAERERSRMFVRALYDYSTDDPTSLSFRAGDIIQVLKQLDSGWWDGIVNGQRGWFPSNYCILVPPGETNGNLLSDDSDDGDEEDSYDEYDNESQSSDSEHGMASPGLPMEGTNLGKTDVTGLWVPQATPHGRLFYFNLETAETRQELPLEAPTSTTESGPRDRSRSIPDQTRPPPEILARGYEREEPLYRSRSDDDDSASEKEGEMLVLNGVNTSVVSSLK
jgi:son of sevenless-like protein